MSPSRSTYWICLALSIGLVGCAGEASYRQGKGLMAEGKIEDALIKLEESTREAPDNIEYRVAYRNARDTVLGQLLSNGQREQSNGNFDAAESYIRRAQKIDPGNARIAASLAAIDKSRRQALVLADVTALIARNDLETADQRLSPVLLDNPQHPDARELKRQIEDKAGRSQVLPPALRKTFRRTVSLEFRDAGFKQVVESLSRHTGLNFVLDKDIPPSLQTTVFLRQVTVEDALDVILTTHQLGSRVMNDSTLLIFPNTTAKQSEHQDLVVKSFYLANTSAKQVMEMLRTVIKAKNIHVDEKLNLVVMRDTPNAIRLAERLVAIQDVSEPEVMLEVEILEVQRSRMQQLGIQFPDQLTLVPLPGARTTVTLADLRNLPSSQVGATLSNTVINLHKDIGETNILANPRIRTRNREKAEIKIGDRVPVITTTSTSTGFVSESVQYVDVGLKLNVEPTIYPDNEIAIRIGLEVSSVVKEVTSKAGSLSYQIGGRNASTVLRLKDGETQILGGLINDQERTTANRIPGLGDLPVVGRLFASQKDDAQKTELILSITPRLIRGIAPPLHVPTEFWSGTENNLRLKPLAFASVDQVPVKAGLAPASPDSGLTRSVPTPSGASDGSSSAIAISASRADGAGEAPALRWSGPTQAKAGETFVLKLMVSSQAGITGFPIQVKYDPSMIEIVDASAGSFLARDGGKVDFGKRIVVGSGLAFLTQNRPSGEAKGDGELMELRVKALKSGPNTVISALPATAIGTGNKPFPQTGPTLTGIAISN